MTTLATLWLPILLAAIAVFVVSSLVHMVLQIHAGDYRKLPNEDAVLAALRQHGVGAGQFMFPHCNSMKEYGSPEMQAKMKQGPLGTLVVRGPDGANMGKALGQWFLFCIVVSVFVAYLTGLSCAPGSDGMRVFRIAATVGLLGYGFSSVADSIWKGIAWSTTARFVFDGLIYALATGGVFALLWPAAV